MAELEAQQTTSNDMSYAEWSAQDRLRQELRELEEQQKSQQTTQDAVAVAQQEWAAKMRRTQEQASRSESLSRTRGGKRRTRKFGQRLPYSFDVLLLCAVTLGLSALVSPLLPSSVTNFQGTKLIPPTPPIYGAAPVFTAGPWELQSGVDQFGYNWSGSKIEFSQGPVAGQSGQVAGKVTFVSGGETKGYADFQGYYNNATRRFDVYETRVTQIADFGRLRLIPGHDFGMIGPDGHTILNGGWNDVYANQNDSQVQFEAKQQP